MEAIILSELGFVRFDEGDYLSDLE